MRSPQIPWGLARAMQTTGARFVIISSIFVALTIFIGVAIADTLEAASDAEIAMRMIGVGLLGIFGCAVWIIASQRATA